MLRCAVFILLFCVNEFCRAQVTVRDYLDREVQLAVPAKRVVALAPHIVENLYSAGAGETLVGTVDHSDYPPAARQISRVGAISAYSLEAIVALNPDLVVLWNTGHAGAVLPKLVALGLTVYVSDPRKLEDIPRSIRDYGILTDRADTAEPAATEFEHRYRQLKKMSDEKSAISVLYQVWNQPLQTLNDQHIISDVIRLCGGTNAFGDAVIIAPKIGLEAVLARDPEAIIASGMGEEKPEWLDDWRKWPNLKAVRNNNLFFIPPDIIQRHTVRMLDGAEMMCGFLQTAREKRRQASN